TVPSGRKSDVRASRPKRRADEAGIRRAPSMRRVRPGKAALERRSASALLAGTPLHLAANLYGKATFVDLDILPANRLACSDGTREADAMCEPDGESAALERHGGGCDPAIDAIAALAVEHLAFGEVALRRRHHVGVEG